MKKFSNLSDDINNDNLLIDIDKIKNGEFEIESIIDVYLDPKDLKEHLTESNIISMNTQLDGDIKRGDKIYVVCLIRRVGSTSFSSPSTQSVLVTKIVDIYSGLSYLNKIK